MQTAERSISLDDLPGVVLLLLALSLAALSYSQGLGGTLHFDDAPSLGGLASVADIRSAVLFSTQGDAGPTGRPLALASFTPQAYAWPDAPEVFLYVNLCLHLLNGLLVAWALHLLCVARGCDLRQAAWVSAASGAVWMLMPILASSSLLIVQRMTTLAATFLLLGFIGYLYSRAMVESRPRLAFFLMSVSVALGATLATLTKENGVLLPVLVLVTEVTLLRRPWTAGTRAWWRAWSAAFLVVPAVVLFVYLALQLRYDESILQFRGFSAPDRLLTEARILWQYLYHAFLPATSNLGPFHDDHPVYTAWLHPLSMLAVAGWLAVIGTAVALRRRAPLYSFAVGWYLVAHALESTTIPLEMYFEHRNYVPLIGPVYGVISALCAVRKWRPIIRTVLCAYSLLLALVLFNTASLWGKPALAGEMWAIRHPDSKRATQYLVQQLERTGQHGTARRMLRLYLEQNPGDADVALQILALTCLLEPETSHGELLDTAEANVRTSAFESGAFQAFRELYEMAKDERCGAVTGQTVYQLASAAAANPALEAVPTALHNLHILMAEEAFAQRDLGLTMHHLESALSAKYTLTTVIVAVQMLSSAGLHAQAEGFVDEAREREPWHPLRAAVWRRHVADLENLIKMSRSDVQST